MSTQGARTGRRPGKQETREEILAAARAEFARKGFQAATVRGIAEAAEVNVALISHYFGGKQQLFAAALQMPEDVRAGMTQALHGDVEGIGERLTRAYLALWENERTRPQLVATVRAAMTSEQGMELLRHAFAGMLDDPGAGVGRARAVSLALGHLLGIAITRHVSRLPTVAGIPFDELVADVAPAVQLSMDRAG